jgi:hypothetical protein
MYVCFSLYRFYPGNMFSATCSYVRKLAPPAEFAGLMESAIEEMVILRLKDQLLTTMLPDRKDRFGLERYSDEHWIGSHPDVKPCDCDPTGPIWQFQNRRVHLNELDFGIAPRPNVARLAPDGSRQAYDAVVNNPNLRLREYYLLAGNLVKWLSIYKKAPPDDSWAWNW